MSILFFFQSIWTPLERVSETPARRFSSASQSTVTSLAVIPSSAPFFAWSYSSALWRIVFAGMQA